MDTMNLEEQTRKHPKDWPVCEERRLSSHVAEKTIQDEEENECYDDVK